MTDKYTDFLANVIIPVHSNLSKKEDEWCPCKFDIRSHTPRSHVNCEQALFHAPELIRQFQFAYVTCCMNWWIENNLEMKSDPFLVSLASVLRSGSSPRDVMKEIKHLTYLRVIQSYDPNESS